MGRRANRQRLIQGTDEVDEDEDDCDTDRRFKVIQEQTQCDEGCSPVGGMGAEPEQTMRRRQLIRQNTSWRTINDRK